jgi:hypothetical protein
MLSSRFRGAGLIAAVLGVAALAPVISSSCRAGAANDEKQIEAW